MKKIVFLMALMLTTLNSHAVVNYLSGNQFYENLKEAKKSQPNNYTSAGIALGYLQGVVDSSNGVRNPTSGTIFCVPSGVSVNQLIDISYAYIENNPQFRHYTADSLIAASLSLAFPCRK
jgi:hypothetical protein